MKSSPFCSSGVGVPEDCERSVSEERQKAECHVLDTNQVFSSTRN